MFLIHGVGLLALESGYALVLSANSHALTLWGVEYEETANGIVITKARVTDSDDKTNQLVESSEFSVKSGSDGNAVAMKQPAYGEGTSFVYDAISGMVPRSSSPSPPFLWFPSLQRLRFRCLLSVDWLLAAVASKHCYIPK